ncbi:MAG: UDP-2,3-diacylglucosamine diphosphatase LpxI [Verrucomicrobia bacterium]|nr:UDP-2,3-diacylglucosamine diphosphatase LpxI [Verrucomicrobiota bacterium]
MENLTAPLFIIAGSGDYPRLVIEGARKAGVQRIAIASFEGETDPDLAAMVDAIFPMRVGQLGKLLEVAKQSGASRAMMAGQIAPSHLFNLRPDFKALVLLAKLKERNAESLFGAVGTEMTKVGVSLISATTFLDDHLATLGLIAGPRLKPRHVEDLDYGFRIAKETSRLDIGQTVVVKNGTVLAVEAFEGTNEAIRRGGKLGKGASTLVKVSKPGQDMRFDVPVVGTKTLEVAAEAGIRIIGVEAGSTILLNRPKVCALAESLSITIYGK